MQSFEHRFLTKVYKTAECWLWKATKRCGYGRVWYKNKLASAHRVSWELYNGVIPEDICVLHKCDVPACVNPEHLFLGTRADNAVDMLKKGRHSRVGGGPSKGLDGRTKLCAEQVLDIRLRQGYTLQALADEFGVSNQHIHRIRCGKERAHVGTTAVKQAAGC